MKENSKVHSLKHISVGVRGVVKVVCLDCGSELLEITIDGKETEGYLCFVCGKELKL